LQLFFVPILVLALDSLTAVVRLSDVVS